MSKYTDTKAFGSEGPLGFPLPDRLAKIASEAIKSQPKELRDRFKTMVDGHSIDGYLRRFCTPKAMSFVDGEHCDISIITSDGVDRDGEVLLPSGIDFSFYSANPLVAWCHTYDILPVGRCEWITRAKTSDGNDGFKAKTRYTPRPKTHPDSAEWFPDKVFAFVQSGDLPGKSIGFIPLSERMPTPSELALHPDWSGTMVIDHAVTLEYSCCPLPVNPQALVESVAKMKAKGLIVPKSFLDYAGVFLPEPMPTVESVTRETIMLTTKSVSEPIMDLTKTSRVIAYLPQHVADCMKMMRDRIPQADLADKGYEEHPHVVVKDRMDGYCIEDVKKALHGQEPLSLKFGKTAVFPATEDRQNEVVHCEVEGDSLHTVHEKLSSLPNSETGEYKPHVALAYTAIGKGFPHQGMEDASGISAPVHTLTYCASDGTETDLAITGREPVVTGTRTKAMGASENVAADGGYSLPVEYADGHLMPSCPLCKSVEKMKTGKNWSSANGVYECENCKTAFKMAVDGSLVAGCTYEPEPDDDMKIKSKGRVTLNRKCVAWAEGAIKTGHIDHGESISDIEHTTINDKYFLAHDGGFNPDNKGYFMFPIGSAKGVNRENLGSASGYAEKNHYADVQKAAARLSDLCDKQEKSPKAVISFVRPETIHKAIELKQAERAKQIEDMVKEEFQSEFARVLGLP